MTTTVAPTDGPQTALARVVRRLRLPYSRTFVARAVAAHPRPQSLLALVEVGASLGVKATPAEVDLSALSELELPLIAHFGGSDSGGFGVVEGVTRDGFRVWDSANGVRRVDRAAFAEHWSGIVALVERAPTATLTEKRYRRNRFVDWVFGRIEPPGVVGSRPAYLVRAVLAVLVLALLGLAIAETPTPDRAVAAVVTLLSLAGLGVASVAAVSISSESSALSDRICARGKLVDCHSVLTSQYSRILGIPLSDIGVAFYGALILLLVTGAIGARAPGPWAIAGLAYAATLPFAVILIGVQIAMRQLCTLCLAVHAINVAAATVSFLWLRPGEWPVKGTLTYALALTLFSSILLFFVIPFFKKSVGLRILSGMRRRISGSPFASLAEILTEESRGIRGEEYAVPMEGADVAHELVLFVHPSCNKCEAALRDVQPLLAAGLVRVAIGLVPKDPEEFDRHACSAVVAAGLALGPPRLPDAYAAAKKNLRALMTGDPVVVLAAELSETPERLLGGMEEARARVDRAEAVVDAHAEGTPAIFIDGRLFRGPLTHLAYLLSEHPDLLAPTLASEDEARASIESAPK